MKNVVILFCLYFSLSSRGVRNPSETNAAMNGMVLDIDWSGLVNQMQNNQAPTNHQAAAPASQHQMTQPSQTQQHMNQPQNQNSMPEYGVLDQAQNMPQSQEAVVEFMEVQSGDQIKIPNVNTLADLIVRSWANTWSMLSQDPNSTITLIYAGYKALEGVEGTHWRLVFNLTGSGNTEFIGLDVAVLANGMIDIFRNIQTRNLTDISVLFGVNISGESSIALADLKVSFFHNSPMILNDQYNAAQANTNGFDISWTQVNVQQTHAAQDNGQLNNLLNNLGGQSQEDPGQMDSDVDIGNGHSDDFGMFDS